MGYIEDLAAREAARQNVEAAKKAEMGRMINQGEVGLAGNVAQVPYANGISVEDAQRLVLAQQAQKANEYRVIQDMISKNRGAQDAAKNIEFGSMWGDTPKDINPVDKAAVQKYQDSVDQGLAAKWMQSYKGR